MTPEQAEYARELAAWARPGTPGYDQCEWLYAADRADKFDPEEYYPDVPEIPIAAMREGSCNTYACIAGRIALDRAPDDTVVVDGEFLRFPDGREEKIYDFAARELGLGKKYADLVFFAEEGDASIRLRYIADHPDATREEILAATGNEEN